MNLRKVIAREGLILLGFAALGLVVYFFAKHLNGVYLTQHANDKIKSVGEMRYCLLGYSPYLRLESLGLFIAAAGYPIFALIRFIAWSIKMLRGK